MLVPSYGSSKVVVGDVHAKVAVGENGVGCVYGVHRVHVHAHGVVAKLLNGVAHALGELGVAVHFHAVVLSLGNGAVIELNLGVADEQGRVRLGSRVLNGAEG